MACGSAGGIAPALPSISSRTSLNRQQIAGFWAAWFGWMLDGMDSVIYALVLGPALTELLPRSGIEATPANIGYVGSLMFGLFLVGWGLSFIWGPISDKFGRTKSLAATILVYAVFTGAAAFSTNVWMLAVFRFLAGIGVGGEWAMAGTYVAEAWPEDRRKMGAGYLQTGYYFGFFVAAALNYTIGASLGWRAMFLCGLFPVVVSIATLLGVKEPLACCVPHKRPIRRKLICAWRGREARLRPLHRRAGLGDRSLAHLLTSLSRKENRLATYATSAL